jgi:hypothetical protein
MKRVRSLIALVLVACLTLAVPALRRAQGVVLAQVSAIYDLSWHVIAGGGGKMESAQYKFLGTVGQSATGQASSSGHTLCSGFWCRDGSAAETPEDYPVYLPLALREFP